MRLGGAPLTLTARSETRLSVVIPENTPLGSAVLTVRAGDFDLRSNVTIEQVAPGLFSADRTGQGVALANLVTAPEDGAAVTPVYECASSSECSAKPIDLAAAGATPLLRFAATVAAGENPSEDVVTFKIPAALAGRGDVDVVITAGERRSNAVRINFR